MLAAPASISSAEFTKREFQLMVLLGVFSDVVTQKVAMKSPLAIKAADQFLEALSKLTMEVTRGRVPVEQIAQTLFLETYTKVSDSYINLPEAGTDRELSGFFATTGMLVLSVQGV